jgi:alpha-1,2-mannosyltransferase
MRNSRDEQRFWSFMRSLRGALSVPLLLANMMKNRFSLFIIQGISLFILASIYIATVAYFSRHPQRTDFVRFYISGRFLVQGKDIYTPVTNRAILALQTDEMDALSIDEPVPQNLNSPLHAIFLAPLAFYDFHKSFWIWSFFSFGCGLAAALLVAKNTFDSHSPPLILGSWILLFGYFPTFVDTYLGQFSLVLLLLITVIWISSRKGSNYLPGIVLGLTISLKVFVGLFLLFFILQRRWRLVFVALASIFLLNMIGAAILGFEPYLRYMNILSNLPWHDSSWNPSFAGFLTRVFTRSEVASLAVSPIIARSAVFGCSLGLLVVMFHSIRRVITNKDFNGFDLGFSMTLIAMLLLSPYGWIYYFAILIIPLMVVWKFSAGMRAGRIYRYCVASAWLLSTIPTAFLRSDNSHLKSGIVVYFWGGIYFYALIAFIVLLTYLLGVGVRHERPHSSLTLGSGEGKQI